ncbi:MAG: response regulator transcription factor [Firmicutes bacterium]|nr:response regulator transcription factor [Bacillota bacterium]
MNTIAVIEDDEYIGKMLEESLTAEGYRVIRAWSGTEALLLLEKQQPSLILLDLMLPGLSGEELLPRVKNTPVIVVSAKVGLDEKVDLLLGGAADYITKPFEMRELLARIAVQLRLHGDKAAAGSILTGAVLTGAVLTGAVLTGAVLTLGSLTLDAETRELIGPGGSVHLTRTESAILKKLMQNPGRPVSKSALLDDISADTPDCTESSLKIHISNLRKKMKEADVAETIDSVWGIGFRLHSGK